MIISHNKIIDDNDEDGNGDTDVQTTHICLIQTISFLNVIGNCS